MRIIKGKPYPMGISEYGRAVNFAFAAPRGSKCRLILYGHAGKVREFIDVTERFGDVFCIAIEDLDENIRGYNYEIEGSVVLDPYARALSGTEQWGSFSGKGGHDIRGVIEGDREEVHGDPLGHENRDVVAYALHVRGFTKDKSSGVKHPGTFQGLVEKIPYLQALGINQIHCMPVYEFPEKGGGTTNYWGYGKAWYFAPRNSYSSDGSGRRGLRYLVKNCHGAGIEVILEMPFYHGIPFSVAGDCLRYYALTFNIDGFILHPDVVPVHLIREDPILSGRKIICHQEDFRRTMRKFLKGDEGIASDVTYWLRHVCDSGSVNDITGHNGFTMRDLVSYEYKHNEDNGENNRDGTDLNYSWNCGAEGQTRKQGILKLRDSQIRNAFLLLILAQGIPCILAGDEMGNSQKGNNNVYCQDNPVGWISWKGLERRPELFDFVRELIAFRRQYQAFCPSGEMSGTDRTGQGFPDISYHGEEAWVPFRDEAGRQIGVCYHETGREQTTCFVAYNMHWIAHDFALPSVSNKKWKVVISTEEGFVKSGESLQDQKKMRVAPRTIMVLICE